LQWLLQFISSAIHINHLIHTKTQTANKTTMICVSNRQYGNMEGDVRRQTSRQRDNDCTRSENLNRQSAWTQAFALFTCALHVALACVVRRSRTVVEVALQRSAHSNSNRNATLQDIDQDGAISTATALPADCKRKHCCLI
jgi:hypothetical protein